MSDRTGTEIELVDPSFLADVIEEDNSFAGTEQYHSVSLMKIIQGQTNDDLRTKFGVGTVLLLPSQAVVWRAGTEDKEASPSFKFVPLFFFAEFCKWTDRKDKEAERMVIARSFDPEGEIAARANDFERRFEMYPGHEDKPPQKQMFYRYVHHLRFVGIIYGDHPLSGALTTLSFQRGEYRRGEALIEALKMRRVEINGQKFRLPMWSQVLECSCSERNGEEGDWWGIDAVPCGVIDPQDKDHLREQHLQLADLHRQQLIRVEEDQDKVEDEGAVKGSDDF